MPKKSSISIFIAATSALAISTANTNSVKSGENDLGGLKEWNTDMALDADFKLDEEPRGYLMRLQNQVLVFPLERVRTAGKSNKDKKKRPNQGRFLLN